jgi:hypothetical protein
MCGINHGILRPFRADRLGGLGYPGLKPWAEGYSPCGASLRFEGCLYLLGRKTFLKTLPNS